MAVYLENLIDISLLSYYDEKLKNWVANRMKNMAETVRFTTTEKLPIEGKEGVLYVTEDGIKIWDAQSKTYLTISSSTSGGSGSDALWGTY